MPQMVPPTNNINSAVYPLPQVSAELSCSHSSDSFTGSKDTGVITSSYPSDVSLNSSLSHYNSSVIHTHLPSTIENTEFEKTNLFNSSFVEIRKSGFLLESSSNEKSDRFSFSRKLEYCKNNNLKNS